jgi:hypothetical protein
MKERRVSENEEQSRVGRTALPVYKTEIRKKEKDRNGRGQLGRADALMKSRVPSASKNIPRFERIE